MSSPRDTAAAGAAIVRWLGFLCLWLILSGPTVTDLVVGATTAVAAAWASLHLVPPAGRWPRPLALASLVARSTGPHAAPIRAGICRRASWLGVDFDRPRIKRAGHV